MKWHVALFLSGGSLFFFIASILLVGRGLTNAAESIVMPEIRFSFQQPSYVTDKNPDLSAFTCDPTKTECKINFDLSPSFIGGLKISDYACEIIGIDSAEWAKCNPNTVSFWSGITEVTFIIRAKVDPSQSISRKITISNWTVTELPPPASAWTDSSSGSVTSSWVTESGTIVDSGATSSGQTMSWVPLPEIHFVFQQATYLLDKNPDLSDYYCDPEKPDCKVNFDLTPSFTGGFREGDYTCHIDGIIETESGKCNPNQVVFGSGMTIVTFTITLKLRPDASILRQIFIHNSGVDSSAESGSWSVGSDSSVAGTGVISDSWVLVNSGATESWETLSGITDSWATTSTGVFVPDPVIEIQSGLAPDFTCEKDECIINLNGESSFATGARMADYACQWSFSGAKSIPSLDSCNPSYIHYLPGEYDVIFHISSRSHPDYQKEKSIHIRNIYVASPVIPASTGNQWGASSIALRAVITPQWPWSKNKYVENDAIICHTETGTCSINFTGENSTAANKSKLKYSWEFGNGETSSVENPLSIIMKTGNYLVSLRVMDELGNSSESTYPVRIFSQMLDVSASVDPNVWMLTISRANPNPSGNDLLEWVEIQNRSANPIGLQGCYLSDASGKKYYFSTETRSIPGEQKWFSGTTGISLTNSKDTIILTCGDREVSRMTWDFPVPDDYILESEYQDTGRESGKIVDISPDGTWQIEMDGARKSMKLRGVDFDFTSEDALTRIRAMFIGQSVSIEYEKEDREATYFFSGTENIWAKLIWEWSVRYVPTPTYRYQKVFEAASLEARKNHRGFWADESLAERANKKISAEKKNVILSEEDPDDYVAWLLSASGSIEKRVQFLEKMTTVTISSRKNEPVIASGKGFSGSELEVIISPDATGSLMSEYVFSGTVSQSGTWSIENISLPPGECVAHIRARLIPTDPFSLLKKQKRFTVQAVTEKIVKPKSKKHSIPPKETLSSEATFSVSLQAWRSRKIAYTSDEIVCHDKKCGINLQIHESAKWTFAYEWDFWDGKKIYGENPKSHIFFAGKHLIMLKALNIETGELLMRHIPVSIIPPPKKPRKKRTTKTKTAQKDKKLHIKLTKTPTQETSPFDPTNLRYLYAFLIISGAGATGHLAWKKRGTVDEKLEDRGKIEESR